MDAKQKEEERDFENKVFLVKRLRVPFTYHEKSAFIKALSADDLDQVFEWAKMGWEKELDGLRTKELQGKGENVIVCDCTYK